MHPPIDQTTKTTILEAVKNGTKVIEVAHQYHVNDKTIYGLLRIQADNSGTSNLEIAKFRREN